MASFVESSFISQDLKGMEENMLDFFSLIIKQGMEYVFILMLFTIFLQIRKLQILIPSLFYGSLSGFIATIFIYLLKKYVIRLEFLDVVEKGGLFLFILLSIIWVIFQLRFQTKRFGKTTLFLFVFLYTLVKFEFILLAAIPQLSMVNGMNTEWIEKIAISLLVIILFLLMAFGMRNLGTKLNIRFVFIILIFQLLYLFSYQLTELLQLLFSLQILPLTMWALEILGPIVNHKEYFFYVLTVSILFFLFLIFISIFHYFKVIVITYVNPAEKRKFISQSLQIKRWFYCFVAILIIFFTFLTSEQISQAKEITTDPPVKVTAIDGNIFITNDMVQDKKLNVFSYTFPDHTEVRFLVVGKTKENVGVALDACSICGVAGYFQKGDQIICKKCNSVINVNTIGFTGGCNPIPLVHEMSDNGKLVIPVSELEKSKSIFQ